MVAVLEQQPDTRFLPLLTTRKPQSMRCMIALLRRISKNGSPLNGGGSRWQTAMESNPLKFVNVQY